MEEEEECFDEVVPVPAPPTPMDCVEQQQQQQQQAVKIAATDTNSGNDVKSTENDWTSMALYVPSGFMQGLRKKYEVY